MYHFIKLKCTNISDQFQRLPLNFSTYFFYVFTLHNHDGYLDIIGYRTIFKSYKYTYRHYIILFILYLIQLPTNLYTFYTKYYS